MWACEWEWRSVTESDLASGPDWVSAWVWASVQRSRSYNSPHRSNCNRSRISVLHTFAPRTLATVSDTVSVYGWETVSDTASDTGSATGWVGEWDAVSGAASDYGSDAASAGACSPVGECSPCA